MFQVFKLKQQEGVHISSERTSYRVTEEIGLIPRKPNSIIQIERKVQISDNLLHRGVKVNISLPKCGTA
ncbi:hypothetical protein HMPREF9163_00563 [Selenomonas sp. oral taxon 138 str. F0429]|nr:hypothetical protein HMPREF9163_00563 [Selenomonas sp. oral taxon 138 str. F0429]